MDSLRKKLEVPPRTDTCVWRRSAEKIQSFAEGLVNFQLDMQNILLIDVQNIQTFIDNVLTFQTGGIHNDVKCIPKVQVIGEIIQTVSRSRIRIFSFIIIFNDKFAKSKVKQR